MSTNKVSIFPYTFHGGWEVTVQDWDEGAPLLTGGEWLERIQVDFTTQEVFLFSVDEKRHCVDGVTYDVDTKTLRNTEGFCLAFWRGPSVDHVFGMIDGQGVWSARKKVVRRGFTDDMIPRLCRTWEITLTSGHHAAFGDVKIRKLHVAAESESDPNTLADLDLGMFGLFAVEKHGDRLYDRLYDILYYDSRVASFNSIFRVRSVNFLPGETSSGDRIFATFDNRSTVPAAHYDPEGPTAEFRLGRMASWETSSAADSVDARRDGANHRHGEPHDDPDTGCWCAVPRLSTR